ncbi:MAG TPA: FkbM family methyltransferase [Pyrinomonadaceae bacterium]
MSQSVTVKQTLVRYLPPLVIHWGKWLSNSGYRHKSHHLSRLKSIPRYQPTTTDILGKPFEIVDSSSFIWMYNEIFEREIYRFRAKTERPYIIDCGANIGLSVSYFKRLYQQSRILAFEPDEKIFEVLKRNVAEQTDVELICRAVWTSETSLSFMSEGADGGRLSGPGDAKDEVVQTIRLRDYLQQPVDLLKLDIEGAETDVLEDCADVLSNVECLFVEYHSFAGRPQTIHKLTTILSGAGFRLHIHPENASPQPFLRREVYGGMDLQLNVFAFRE